MVLGIAQIAQHGPTRKKNIELTPKEFEAFKSWLSELLKQDGAPDSLIVGLEDISSVLEALSTNDAYMELVYWALKDIEEARWVTRNIEDTNSQVNILTRH